MLGEGRSAIDPIVRAAALLAALGGGVLLGCPLEFERGVSCGDGWWDTEYEECDPTEPASYLGACRAEGFSKDGSCDPQTCKLEVSEEDCNVCGDGIAAASEQCDGDDLRDASCGGNTGTLTCTADCKLDYSGCPVVCGDGVVSGSEECEPDAACVEDGDCVGGRVCFMGHCIHVGNGFTPNLACSNFETTAVTVDKSYASGTVSECTDSCQFGRDDCSFCGDGELDDVYTDRIAPNDLFQFPAEICDGDEADASELSDHCEPLCIDEPINADILVGCDFECRAGCDGFALPSDVVPSDPDSLGCCLPADQPCPTLGYEGVPDLPCCSWIENPAWAEIEKCVVFESQVFPVAYVCP